MDFALVTLAIAVVAAALIVAYAVMRKPAPAMPDGRLDAVIQAQGEISGQFRSTLTAQAELQRTLTEQIATLSKRLNDSLNENATKATETFTSIQERLKIIDEAQKNITSLGTQVMSLQEILSDKQARGAWGEYRMEDIIRDQLPSSLYNFTGRLSNDSKPDCLIKMPNVDALIVIDAKFPLEGFEALRASSTDAERKAAASQIRTTVMKHVKDIRDKYLIVGEVQSPAIMFVPSESIFRVLSRDFSDLIQKAQQSQVAILSPQSLWLAINTIRVLARDARIAADADKIRREVALLIDNVDRLGKRINNLRSHFSSANEDIAEIEVSMGKVANHANTIRNLKFEKTVEVTPQLPSPKSPDSP